MIKILVNKWVHIFLLCFVLLWAVVFGFSDSDLQKRFQHFVFDNYNKIYPREPTDDVIIVDLDENSLRIIGQWPWSRDIVADLITKLDDMGAKVIAFDMVFAEEDRTSPVFIADRLPDSEDFLEAKKKISQLPDNDRIFSEAIKKTGKVVTGFTYARANETRRAPALPVPPTFLVKDKDSLIKISKNDKKDSLQLVDGAATNLLVLSNAVAGNGHFMASPEADGILRQVSLFARYSPPQVSKSYSRLYPSLSLEALRVSLSPKAKMIVREVKEKKLFDLPYQIKLGKYEIPMESNTKFWVYYRNMSRDKDYIPAHFILKNNSSDNVKKRIKDKIVFIGTSAEGLRDIRSTPLLPYVPGVEVHVNVVEQILQGSFLKRSHFVKGVEPWIVAVLGVTIIVLASLTHVVLLATLTFLFIGLLFVASWYGFTEHGILLDPVYPGSVLFMLFISSSLLSYLRSEVDRRQVKTAFGHYISPVFMEELTKNPEKLKLGGDMRDLTVMFTDIRSFTKISERLSPEELIQLMNDFLTPMSNLVMESRGTIDKYMGDAMMAFWNAPLDDPDHARQACITALQMNKALEPINLSIKERMEKKGEKPFTLSAGIGINTGLCSVGNMGSKQRFAYSALGDVVNLASRLEGQTKTYGVDTLIGEDTYKLVNDFALIELDLIQVVGREQPIHIYTLIGDQAMAQDESFKKWQAAHNGMLAAYRAADFSCAAQDCKDASDLSGGRLNEYYDLYKKRIIKYTKNPPPEDWDGVFIAKSK